MKISTPFGPKLLTALAAGCAVMAFDPAIGRECVNSVEKIERVDRAEYRRWHNGEFAPFRFFTINDRWTLFQDQSIWLNGNVSHVAQIKLGDTIYDGEGNEIIVRSIAKSGLRKHFWRLDVSDNHSYVIDGLLLHNASRFWVLGTGTWDSSDTTHWAASSGAGAGGSSVPGVADTVTFDGSSGGGTVTVNFGGTITVQSITCGAFTGSLDFSVNNNSVTLSASFSGTGSATRTIRLGNGTWTLTGTGAIWTMATTTGLTWSANSSNIVCSATSGSTRSFTLGAIAYASITISANSSFGAFTLASSGSSSISTLTITGPNYVLFSTNTTYTLTNLAVNGTSAGQVALATTSLGTAATLSIASNPPTVTWTAIRDVAFSGAVAKLASNSFDIGSGGGITINRPSAAIAGSPGMTGGING